MSTKDFKETKISKKVLITSGPTYAPLDDIRFISNHSTGRFGTFVANAVLKKGANVTFLYGEYSKTPLPHPNLELIPVRTHQEVASMLEERLTTGSFDLVIHAMAVLDYKAQVVRCGKTKTDQGDWTVELTPTSKIINQIKKWSPQSKLVGFKLESALAEEALLERAKKLLKESKADWVLANQLTPAQDKEHEGIFLDHSGDILFREKGKEKIAELIVETAL